MEFLALFDAANVSECYRRSESVVPQQALALANSPLTLDRGLIQGRVVAIRQRSPANHAHRRLSPRSERVSVQRFAG